MSQWAKSKIPPQLHPRSKMQGIVSYLPTLIPSAAARTRDLPTYIGLPTGTGPELQYVVASASPQLDSSTTPLHMYDVRTFGHEYSNISY